MPACTITLQNVVDWARTQIKLIPLVGVGGFTNEPALTICNQVLQEMLMGGVDNEGKTTGPFPWKFNRASFTFNTEPYTQDYEAKDLTDLSWIESATFVDKNDTSDVPTIHPLEVARDLAPSSYSGEPARVCWTQLGDTIYYRLEPRPGSGLWTVTGVYQKKPPVKTALNTTWAPIPDDLAYVYRQGFLAMAKKHAGNPDWVQDYRLFQIMINKALGVADREQETNGFVPERPILL